MTSYPIPSFQTDPLGWFGEVSKLARKICNSCLIGYRDATDYPEQKESILRDLKPLMSADIKHLEALIEVKSDTIKLGNLLRHLRFFKLVDIFDIATFDIPTIVEACETEAIKAYRGENLGEIDDYIHKYFQGRYRREMLHQEPDYCELVLSSCIILGEEFCKKSEKGQCDDTTIGKVFNPDKPLLKVRSDLDQQTRRNFQRGLMLLFQGAHAFLRNTTSHKKIKIGRQGGLRALLTLSLIAQALENSELSTKK